eukprot:CCRYP_017311-RE/>CCRYP_017311-RE protein AED:0.04 eAED:0.04 QI:125/1/1/1/0.6/0.45/11/3431/292
MRLFLSSAALTAISTSVLVANKTNWSADAKESSLRVATDGNNGYKATIGMECNDFRSSPSISSTLQSINRTSTVDVGLLKCDSDFSCIRDATSSTGGRCIPSSTSRSLQTCDKCIGYLACYRLSQTFIDDNIGCGSCIGNYSCAAINQATTTIGTDSCIGFRACYGIIAQVGDSSCVESTGGNGMYEAGFSCGLFVGVIGENSCKGYSACYQIYTSLPGYNFTIGDDSCNGNDSCEYLRQGLDYIKSGSCNDVYACYQIEANVGYRSCNGYYSCAYIFEDAIVGDDSWCGSN